jgi:carbonic anhydrase/acetyltransferase-like protein (isoleucine patch superfamily)
MVFNGANLGPASSVAIGAAVQIRCHVPAETRIPIGWVAVGDPARLYPPDWVDEIRAGLEEFGGSCPSCSAPNRTWHAPRRCIAQ